MIQGAQCDHEGSSWEGRVRVREGDVAREAKARSYASAGRAPRAKERGHSLKGTKNEFFPSLADILPVATKTHFQASRTVRQQIRVVTSH